MRLYLPLISHALSFLYSSIIFFTVLIINLIWVDSIQPLFISIIISWYHMEVKSSLIILALVKRVIDFYGRRVVIRIHIFWLFVILPWIKIQDCFEPVFWRSIFFFRNFFINLCIQWLVYFWFTFGFWLHSFILPFSAFLKFV